MSRVVLLAGLTLAGASWAQLPGFAQPDEQQTSAVAVQDRYYKMMQEISVGVSLLPADPYTRGLAVQAGYVWHFNDSFAWQIARGGFSAKFPTSLRQQLERDFLRSPTEFEAVSFYAGSDLMWKPLYGKLSALDRFVLHGELYLMVGGGVLGYLTPVRFRPGLTLGGGGRLHLTRLFSLRFEVTDTIGFPFAGAGGVVNVLNINLLLGLNLGATE